MVSKGKGVVRDPKVWASVLCDVAGAFEAAGAAVVGGMPSPLLGAEGNVEFFLHLRNGAKPLGAAPAQTGPATEGTATEGTGPEGTGPEGTASSRVARADMARCMDALALSGVPRLVPNTGGGE